MSMKELDPDQIAAALAGHPVGPWRELRFLILFQSEAGDRVVVEPGARPLPKAA